jgi:hypothetical protein
MVLIGFDLASEICAGEADGPQTWSELPVSSPVD